MRQDIPTFGLNNITLDKRSTPKNIQQIDIFSADAQKLAADMLLKGVLAVTEVFVYSGNLQEYSMKEQGSNEAVTFNAKEVRDNFKEKINELLGNFHKKIIELDEDAKSSSKAGDTSTIGYTSPIRVEFEYFNPESKVLSELFRSFDILVQGFDTCWLQMSITDEQRKSGIGVYRAEIVKIIRELRKHSFIMKRTRLKAFKKKQTKTQAKVRYVKPRMPQTQNQPIDVKLESAEEPAPESKAPPKKAKKEKAS